MIVLDAQIADVRVQVSIFHKDGYKTVDLELLTETMNILAVENDELVQDWSGPDHCDAYLMLSYETWADAHDKAVEDSERLRSRATEVYQDCAERKAKRAEIQARYDEWDKAGCEIDNGERKPEPGEYQEICREMDSLQEQLDELAPYEFDDKRDVGDVVGILDRYISQPA